MRPMKIPRHHPNGSRRAKTMAGKIRRWRNAFVLSVVMLAPSSAFASDWSDYFWWWPAPRFARGGDYSPLHYWVPETYYIREYVRPSNLDQYPAGPTPSVAPSYEVYRYCSPTIPPAPSSPYANPTAYYGRSVQELPRTQEGPRIQDLPK
jgi:hypothetical protein